MMTDRMKNGECCPYNGFMGNHSPWCHTLRVNRTVSVPDNKTWSKTIDYAPFAGDGRINVQPTVLLPNVDERPVTRAQARAMIKAFVEGGHSTHSAAGGTLWVILTWCQHHRAPYELQAQPGFGYRVRRI